MNIKGAEGSEAFRDSGRIPITFSLDSVVNLSGFLDGAAKAELTYISSSPEACDEKAVDDAARMLLLSEKIRDASSNQYWLDGKVTLSFSGKEAEEVTGSIESSFFDVVHYYMEREQLDNFMWVVDIVETYNKINETFNPASGE